MRYDHPNYTVLRSQSGYGVQVAANGELLGSSLQVAQKSLVFAVRVSIMTVGSGGQASALAVNRFGADGTASAIATLVATGTLAANAVTSKIWTAPITLEANERIGLLASSSAATDAPDCLVLWRYKVLPTVDDVDVPAGLGSVV